MRPRAYNWCAAELKSDRAHPKSHVLSTPTDHLSSRRAACPLSGWAQPVFQPLCLPKLLPSLRKAISQGCSHLGALSKGRTLQHPNSATVCHSNGTAALSSVH